MTPYISPVAKYMDACIQCDLRTISCPYYAYVRARLHSGAMQPGSNANGAGQHRVRYSRGPVHAQPGHIVASKIVPEHGKNTTATRTQPQVTADVIEVH